MMSGMPEAIDTAAIKVRQGRRYSQDRVGTDLWVELPGLGREAAAAAVESALARTGDTFGYVLPTSGGTYLWRADVNEAKHLPERLLEALRADGHEAMIGVAPVDPCPQTLTDVAFPGAVMAYRTQHPADAADRYEDGRLKATWGVHRGPTERLLARTTRWVLSPDAASTVGRISSVPLTADDAIDLVGRELARNPLRLLLVRWRPDLTGMRRVVRFDGLGRVAWTDLDAAADPLDLAEAAVERLVEDATELDYGCVRMVHPGATEFADGPAGYWRHHRDAWATHVPDAYGIQLLTVAQLDRAADLSAWVVQPVAPDRFLVRARDLEPWFVPAGPSEEVRDRARADFGALVLDRPTHTSTPAGRTFAPDFVGQHCHAELFCTGEHGLLGIPDPDEDESPEPEPVFARWLTPQARGLGRGIEVDWVGLHTRADAHWGRHVDLRVDLDGLDRQESARTVAEAVREVLGDGAADVRATTGGTWLVLPGDGWATVVTQCVERWEGAGFTGAVSPSEVDPWSESARPRVPATVMALPPEVPHEQWERTTLGVPMIAGRWGVSAALTRRVLDETAGWIGQGHAVLDHRSKVPVTAEDLTDLLSGPLETAARIEVCGRGRYVSFQDFGACAFSEIDARRSVLEQVAAATRRLVEWAPDLVYGCVSFDVAGSSAFHGSLDTSSVRRAPHLLSSYAPGAHGVQVLTGAHLARAHDLSAWTVEEVARDRFLVSARNPAVWFPEAESGAVTAPREVLKQAESDFGDMLLTFDVARANPPFPLGG